MQCLGNAFDAPKAQKGIAGAGAPRSQVLRSFESSIKLKETVTEINPRLILSLCLLSEGPRKLAFAGCLKHCLLFILMSFQNTIR